MQNLVASGKEDTRNNFWGSIFMHSTVTGVSGDGFFFKISGCISIAMTVKWECNPDGGDIVLLGRENSPLVILLHPSPLDVVSSPLSQTFGILARRSRV